MAPRAPQANPIAPVSRKGIVLAGGLGTRMYPLTISVSKQLLPVYDKPLVYYPLSTLMQAGIRNVLVITTARDAQAFQRLLGDGSRLGISISYAIQTSPGGLAQAFLIGREFIGQDHVTLVLGDNLFFGQGLHRSLEQAAQRTDGATIFAYRVRDPERYGVVEFDAQGHPSSIQEKPSHSQSPFAIPGLYFYDNQVVDFAAGLKPSARGELEITDVNRLYLHHGALHVEVWDRGFTWLDAGTPESLMRAAGVCRGNRRTTGPEDRLLRGTRPAVRLHHPRRTPPNRGGSPFVLRRLPARLVRMTHKLPALGTIRGRTMPTTVAYSAATLTYTLSASRSSTNSRIIS